MERYVFKIQNKYNTVIIIEAPSKKQAVEIFFDEFPKLSSENWEIMYVDSYTQFKNNQ